MPLAHSSLWNQGLHGHNRHNRLGSGIVGSALKVQETSWAPLPQKQDFTGHLLGAKFFHILDPI